MPSKPTLSKQVYLHQAATGSQGSANLSEAYIKNMFETDFHLAGNFLTF